MTRKVVRTQDSGGKEKWEGGDKSAAWMKIDAFQDGNHRLRER